MELKNVFIFTSDSKNGKLLELNAGAHSRIETLNKEYKNKDTITDKIIPYLADKIETHIVCSVTGYGSIGSSFSDRIEETLEYNPSLRDQNTLFIRGHSLSGNVNSAEYIISEVFPHVTLDNNNSSICQMYEDKSTFFKMIEDSDTKHTPHTKSYSMLSLQDNNGTPDFANFSHVVIKPVNGLQGEGVFVIKGEDCQKVTQSLANKDFNTVSMLANGNCHKAVQHWENTPHNTIQIQEFVTGVPFEHKGKQWDATDRHLWSVIQYQDENGKDHFDVECHGAFKKLPAVSKDKQIEVSQENAVSVSHISTIEKLINSVTKESGSGEKVFTPKEDDINRDKLASDLLAIFKTAIKHDQNIASKAPSNAKDMAYLSLSQSSAGHMPITPNPQST